MQVALQQENLAIQEVANECESGLKGLLQMSLASVHK
jgi:hypothetical protein